MPDPATIFHSAPTVSIARAIANREDLSGTLKAAPTLNEQGDKGVTLLIWALLQNNLPALGDLIEAGADASLADEDGLTVLHLAAKITDSAGLSLLLGKGVSPDLRNPKTQETALFDAIISQREEHAKILIEANADLNAQDDMGDTPLHRAAGTGVSRIAILLLEAGADPAITNTLGQTSKPLFLVTPEENLTPSAREDRKTILQLMATRDGE